MITGILSIDKPRGPTSHDVVARTRRIVGQRRVGHTGTLDPLATGVLVVCLGKATRVAEYVAAAPKAYQARVRFGVTTDSSDAEGQVLVSRPWEGLSLAAIEAVLPDFVGSIEQIPPMYSALKHKGIPLYRLARRGVTVERKPRRVQVYSIEIVDWQPPDLVLDVRCSKGTYIRSLAHDLGKTLGPGAHLAGLVRTAVGRFHLSDSVPLGTLEAEASEGTWQRHLLPIESGLEGLPSIVVDALTARCIGYGQVVGLPAAPSPQLCAYDETCRLIAILEPDADSDLWKPHKVFVPS